MRITVKLFATFRTDRFKIEEREVPSGTEVGHIVRELGIAESELGIVLVNARHAALDQHLQEGDILSLFPLVGGG
jgi:molybdopterin converting factor small subunit